MQQLQIARSVGSVAARPALLRHAAAAKLRAAPAGGRQRGVCSVRAGLMDWINEGKTKVAVAAAGEYNQAATKAAVDKYIADNPVVVFSWSGCPYCKKAKQILDAAGAKYTALELDQMAEGKAIRAELAKLTGRSSVPNIWIAGQSVGGCNDGPGVATLQDQGKLVPMLQAAGAL